MPGTSLLFLTLLCVPAFAQTPKIEAWVTAQQNLIRELRGDLARYTPQSPRVSELQACVGVLEEQSRLLQQPRERWAPDAINAQVKAINLQLDMLRHEVANYKLTHPAMSRSRAIINLLEAEL